MWIIEQIGRRNGERHNIRRDLSMIYQKKIDIDTIIIRVKIVILIINSMVKMIGV